MAYLIFNDLPEFKTYIGGGANLSLEMDSIAGSMHDAARDHLIPWLSQAQWSALVDAVTNDDATTEEDALLPYVRRALAHLTMFEYSKIGGIQFSEAGIFRTENETHKSAYKYQENSYRDYMLEKGYEAIEELLVFLEANEDDYNPWYASNAYARNKSLLLNTAATFRDCYAAYISRYTFELLRPLIEDLETFALRPLLGDEEMDRLKAAVLAKNTTADQDTLIGMLQKALANFAIREGTKRFLVRLEGRNIVQSERSDSQDYDKTTSPTGNTISLGLLAQDAWANRHISLIKRHLDANLETFDLYADYQEELAEAAAAAGDGNFATEDATGCWQLELTPGAIIVDEDLDRGEGYAGGCPKKKAGPPIFRM